MHLSGHQDPTKPCRSALVCFSSGKFAVVECSPCHYVHMLVIKRLLAKLAQDGWLHNRLPKAAKSHERVVQTPLHLRFLTVSPLLK